MLCSIISEKSRLGRKSEWLCVHAMVALRHAELVHEPRQCLACLPRLQGTCLLCAVRFNGCCFFPSPVISVFCSGHKYQIFFFNGWLSCVLYN